ncbi:MAG: hypothetical protein ABIN18_29165 [Pseudomonadota bacterium]
MEKKSTDDTRIDLKDGFRTRETISNDIVYSACVDEQYANFVGEHTQRLILEVLLDIRDLLSKNMGKQVE